MEDRLIVKLPDWFVWLFKLCWIFFLIILLAICIYFFKTGLNTIKVIKLASLFVILMTSSLLFYLFRYYLLVDESGIDIIYKTGKRSHVNWDEIVAFEKFRFNIPYSLRKVRCQNGKIILITIDMKNYSKLAELIKARAGKLVKFEK